MAYGPLPRVFCVDKCIAFVLHLISRWLSVVRLFDKERVNMDIKKHRRYLITISMVVFIVSMAYVGVSLAIDCKDKATIENSCLINKTTDEILPKCTINPTASTITCIDPFTNNAYSFDLGKPTSEWDQVSSNDNKDCYFMVYPDEIQEQDVPRGF